MGLLAKATELLEAQKRELEEAAKIAADISETAKTNMIFKTSTLMQPSICENSINKANHFNSDLATNKINTKTNINLKNKQPEDDWLPLELFGEFVKPTPKPESKTTSLIKAVPENQVTKKTVNTNFLKNHKRKLRRLIAGFAIGMAAHFTSQACLNQYQPREIVNHEFNITNTDEIHNINPLTNLAIPVHPVQPQNETTQTVEQAVNTFTQGLTSRVTKAEREALARMLYGEAGRGADPFEILHTVFNRASSPLFKGSLLDIVTQKNQYVGYSPKHPLTNDYLTIVDMGVDYWEAHNCEKIDGCDHYYFVQGIAGVCNEFEISPKNSNGKWVPTKDKKYAKMRNYCPVATDQAKRYYANRQAYQKAYGHTK